MLSIITYLKCFMKHIIRGDCHPDQSGAKWRDKHVLIGSSSTGGHRNGEILHRFMFLKFLHKKFNTKPNETVLIIDSILGGNH